jgi:hypothetical protein
MKTVISRRYYPNGSKICSYRSYFIGSPRKGTADRVIGYCDPSVADGWVPGPRGGIAARGPRAQVLASIEGFRICLPA